MLSRVFLLASGIVLATALVSRADEMPQPPRTPIKHLIVVVGENHSFDNVFATYVPPDKTQIVWNLLSLGVIDKDGNPRPNVRSVEQMQAQDTGTYQLRRRMTGTFPYLPQPQHDAWCPSPRAMPLVRAVHHCA